MSKKVTAEEAMNMLKQALMNPTFDLRLLDSKYFTDDDDVYTDAHAAAHRLATWLYDNEGREQQCRLKIKKHFPSLYTLTLEKFVDGDHDT